MKIMIKLTIKNQFQLKILKEKRKVKKKIKKIKDIKMIVMMMKMMRKEIHLIKKEKIIQMKKLFYMVNFY